MSSRTEPLDENEELEPAGSSEIPLERLRSVTHLPFNFDQITSLSLDWDQRVGRRTWSDIQWLAQQFLRRSSDDPVEAEVGWYHLVMAIGNFKRSTGTIYPAHLPLPDDNFNPPLSFKIPGTGAQVRVDDRQSWRSLTEIRGLGVPTATTLLSAVWPSHHVIIDRRDAVAAVGMTTRIWDSQGFEDAKMPDRDSYDRYWDLYEWFLAIVKTTASNNTDPVDVERALFMVDIEVRTLLPKKGNWQWSRYTERSDEFLSKLNAQIAGSQIAP